MMRISRAFVALIVGLPLVAPPRAAAQDERPVLELSLQDAVDRALQNNLDIMIAKFNPDSSAQSVRGAQGAAYDPFLSGQFSQFSAQSQASNSLAGGESVKSDRFTYNFSASQYVPTGGRFRLDFSNFRQTSNSNLTTRNPLFDSSLTLSLTQPLLRGFSLDAPRQQILVAKKNREISDVQFHETVVNTVASVKQLYWELIFAIDNLEAQRTSLGLAGKFLNENQIKVKVGTMAPLDVVQAQSEVARVEGDVITAENALNQAEDRLKQAIIPKNDPATWAVRIVPKDRPTAEPIGVDVDAAIAKALGQRTDVVAARKGVERANINLDYAKSLTRPQLDLVASYGSSGVGGPLLTRNPPFGGPVVATTPGGYGDALSSVFGRDNPTWTLGVNVSYPIGNRQASASRAQAQIAREQAEVSLRRLELQIALDVRTAGRSVETNSKLVQATQAARVLQEQRLDAEDKKFAAGMSTNFLVTQAQRDLAVARVQELRAIANYRESLINFERVQEAGGGGSSIAISTGGSGISSFNSSSSSSSSSSAASNSGSNQ
jgi:outer membrane protein